jgi:hypothetical protein
VRQAPLLGQCSQSYKPCNEHGHVRLHYTCSQPPLLPNCPTLPRTTWRSPAWTERSAPQMCGWLLTANAFAVVSSGSRSSHSTSFFSLLSSKSTTSIACHQADAAHNRPTPAAGTGQQSIQGTRPTCRSALKLGPNAADAARPLRSKAPPRCHPPAGCHGRRMQRRNVWRGRAPEALDACAAEAEATVKSWQCGRRPKGLATASLRCSACGRQPGDRATGGGQRGSFDPPAGSMVCPMHEYDTRASA